MHIDNGSQYSPIEVINNSIVHSKLYEFDKSTKNSKLSIKIVLNGRESYRINNTSYCVDPGDFLIVDENQELDIGFLEKQKVEGMCYYLDKSYLFQNSNIVEKGIGWVLDNWGNKLNNSLPILSAKYKSIESNLGVFLLAKSKLISIDNDVVLSEDLFVEMANKLFIHQNDIYKNINQITSLKLSTREELYKRTIIVKDFIDQNLNYEDLTIKTLSKISCLSEVQLHRSFKQVYRISPYRYILNLRLEKASQLIITKDISLTDVSIAYGFIDLATFSKAFKLKYGVSPTQYRKSN